jgi:hypothetical protein
MLVRSWLDALKLHLAHTPNRRQRRAAGQRGPATHHPRLETLEDRRVLALAGAVNYPVGANPQAIVSADFTNDGLLDLATANYDGTTSVLVANAAAPGAFHQPAVTSATGALPLSLAVGDFDDDGNLDLATANAYDVSVMLGDGAGAFGSPTSYGVIGNPASVAVGDFNGDGLLDLGVTSNLYFPPPPCDEYSYCYYYGNYESYANVLLGNADADGKANGTFSPASVTFLDYADHNTALAADLNGDQYDDFVTFHNFGYVTVLLGNSSGLQGPTFHYTGDYSLDVAAADLDGDGDTDLVTANYYANSIGVLLGDGLGGFSGPVQYATGGYPMSVVVGDFTDDGQLDVLAANSGSGQLVVLHGHGDGTFTLPAIAATVSSAWAIAAGDFNGDGWLDAATANSSTSNVSVLTNDRSWPVPVPPNVTIKDVTKNEGNSGITIFSFTVELSQASSQAVTVSFATANGTARTSDSDYLAAVSTVTIGAGQKTATINISVRGDKRKEAAETFFVNLTGATNATITDAQAIGTIANDDGGGKRKLASLESAFLASDSVTTTKKRR